MALIETPREEREAIGGTPLAERFALTGAVVYRGLASTVFLAIERATQLQVVVKVLLKKSFNSDEERRNAKAEVQIHSQLPPHPNVIRLLAAEETQTAMLLVTPYTRHGDLWELTRYSQTYCEGEVRNCTAQMLAALRHIHGATWGGSSLGVIHGDVKPHNFLLFLAEGKHVVQLCDFGLTERPGSEGTVRFRGVKGTSGWHAPEVLDRRDYGQAVDLFGVGLITFRMLGGYPPFDPPSKFQEPVEFEDCCWCHVTTAAKDFIQRLLTIDPAGRETAAGACEHEWIAGPTPPEPTPEQLEKIMAYGPPPRTDVLFWPLNEVPDLHERLL